jgi:hypothetical protein
VDPQDPGIYACVCAVLNATASVLSEGIKGAQENRSK